MFKVTIWILHYQGKNEDTTRVYTSEKEVDGIILEIAKKRYPGFVDEDLLSDPESYDSVIKKAIEENDVQEIIDNWSEFSGGSEFFNCEVQDLEIPEEAVLKGNMKANFKKVSENRSIIGSIFLVIHYVGGDADYYEKQEVELKTEHKFNPNFDVNLIKDELEPYRILKNITDVNHIDYCKMTSEVDSDLIRFWDDVPWDPMCDYSMKCAIDRYELKGYADDGAVYKADLTF